jgi:hypothetical protein
MHVLEELGAGTLKHLVKRGLLKLHRAELAKDPTSATESSRSNLMEVRQTVKQLYGSTVATDVADLVKLAMPAQTSSKGAILHPKYSLQEKACRKVLRRTGKSAPDAHSELKWDCKRTSHLLISENPGGE